MAILTSVNIRKNAETAYADPHSIYLIPGDNVILHTENGLERGIILEKEKVINDYQGKTYRILRKFNSSDYAKLIENKKKEKEALAKCNEKIELRKLIMKLTSVEYTFDLRKLFVYYTAEGRVDFRELIKDLSSILKTKIQMVQIGVRDEARMLGGYGHCGQPVCCSQFLKEFRPVVIDMVKDQGLSLNPSKISGLCGRLICCLSYEHPFYKEMCAKIPKVGSKISTKDGNGLVKSIHILKGEVEVIFDDGSAKKYKVEDLPPINSANNCNCNSNCECKNKKTETQG
jgi:cell fate regulator YaaT (PSP1 superfamily)